MSMMELPESAVASAVTNTVRKTRRKKPVTIDEAIPSLSVDERKQYYAVEYYSGDVYVFEYTGHDAYRATAEATGTRLIIGPFNAVDTIEAQNLGCSLLASIDDVGWSVLEGSFYRYCNSFNAYGSAETKHLIFFALERSYHNYDDDSNKLRHNYPECSLLIREKISNTLRHRKFMMKMHKFNS